MDKVNVLIDFVHKPFNFIIARIISMILALFLSVVLTVNPGHIAQSIDQLDHGYLSLLMLALSAAFIHGIGFNPIFWLWKILFSPYFSWVILFSFIASRITSFL